MTPTPLGWLTTLLTIIFVVLKLTEEITWPWIGVLAPTLIHFGIWFLLLAASWLAHRIDR